MAPDRTTSRLHISKPTALAGIERKEQHEREQTARRARQAQEAQQAAEKDCHTMAECDISRHLLSWHQMRRKSLGTNRLGYGVGDGYRT